MTWLHELKRVEFWVAMMVALMLKLRASPPMSVQATAGTVVTGVGSAVLFTSPLVDVLGVDSNVFRDAVAALVFLTAEQASRAILSLTLADVVKIWKGK